MFASVVYYLQGCNCDGVDSSNQLTAWGAPITNAWVTDYFMVPSTEYLQLFEPELGLV